MSNHVYIGIDNGLNGGMVALSNHPGSPIALRVMPTIGKEKGNEVNAELVWSFLDEFERDAITVILETPGKHSPGVMALCSMWDSYGVIRGILASRGIRHHRVMPQAWQRVMLTGCKKGDTKPAALAKAKQLWPHESFIASPKCTKPHDGLIDAALIAEFGRISGL